jgi:hypothetical protein
LEIFWFVKIFFSDHIFPETRFDAKKTLMAPGLEKYDVLAIVKITHGLNWDDFNWVKFVGEKLDYEDIKAR